MNLHNEISKRKKEIAGELESAIRRPFKVSVIGDGGSGKSTLINTLFNTDLKTGPSKPTTRFPKPIEAKTKDGKGGLIFIDLPGVGESHSLDIEYANYYLNYGMESDVILWSINSENRNVVYTIDFINKLLDLIPDYRKKVDFFNKFIFIITKVDLIKQGKWTFKKYKSGYRVYPDKTIKFILDEKMSYFRFSILKEFSHLIETSIYTGQKSSNIKEDYFELKDGKLTCKKLLDVNDYKYLSTTYKRNNKRLKRIIRCQSPIVCSSLYKYNLSSLLLSIIDKVEDGIFSLEKLIDTDRIMIISNEELDEINNIQIIK